MPSFKKWTPLKYGIEKYLAFIKQSWQEFLQRKGHPGLFIRKQSPHLTVWIHTLTLAPSEGHHLDSLAHLRPHIGWSLLRQLKKLGLHYHAFMSIPKIKVNLGYEVLPNWEMSELSQVLLGWGEHEDFLRHFQLISLKPQKSCSWLRSGYRWGLWNFFNAFRCRKSLIFHFRICQKGMVMMMVIILCSL